MLWGLVATILAPTQDILNFAAYHLEAGAHRLYLFLDAENPEAEAALRAHPKVRVALCDAAHWKRLQGKRPEKHQSRQTVNATHAYAHAGDVDWLIHMDVDEFLVSDTAVADHLAALPDHIQTARTRPMERLAGGDGTAFKRFIPPGPQREKIVAQLYPTFGEHLKGGFLSHLAGKVFLKTGLPDIKFRIHNVFQGENMNPNEVRLDAVDLAHCHASNWEDWIAHFRYRHASGSYRADLGPARARGRGGMSMHELFATIESDSGEAGLRAFFDEVCTDTPTLRANLDAHGLLGHAALNLDALRQKHFPQSPL